MRVTSTLLNVLVLLVVFQVPGTAFAQDLGSTAMAMDAAGSMGANATRGAQAQINRASAIAGTPAPTPAVAAGGAPAAAATPAPAPGAGATPAATPGSGAAATSSAKVAPAAPVVPAPEAAAVDLHLPFEQSFFFTPDDLINLHKAIEAQKNLDANGNPKGLTPGGESKQQVYIPPIRRIRLSAVVYKDPQNWMVWLNNQKVTPTATLPEIMDIKVEKDLIHLKWFDIGANKVLLLTMRPNETYDIVTGVLLPG